MGEVNKAARLDSVWNDDLPWSGKASVTLEEAVNEKTEPPIGVGKVLKDMGLSAVADPAENQTSLEQAQPKQEWS